MLRLRGIEPADPKLSRLLWLVLTKQTKPGPVPPVAIAVIVVVGKMQRILFRRQYQYHPRVD